MKSVNIHEAKTHLSRLLQEVANGEQFVINKAGKPVAMLVPFQAASISRRQPGLLKGKVWIAEDFDAPLPDDLLNLFEGKDDEANT